jgi:hypothetical protein
LLYRQHHEVEAPRVDDYHFRIMRRTKSSVVNLFIILLNDPINAQLSNRRPTHRALGILSPAERRKMYDAARPSPSRLPRRKP